MIYHNNVLLKRQFLDWLYEHPRKYRKIFKVETKSGYFIKLSPNELLKEIDNKTDIGNKILNQLENDQENIFLMKNFIKEL